MKVIEKGYQLNLTKKELLTLTYVLGNTIEVGGDLIYNMFKEMMESVEEKELSSLPLKHSGHIRIIHDDGR